MEITDKKMNKRVEDLTTSSVVLLLERWEMTEFVDFVREKQLDGRKLMVSKVTNKRMVSDHIKISSKL